MYSLSIPNIKMPTLKINKISVTNVPKPANGTPTNIHNINMGKKEKIDSKDNPTPNSDTTRKGIIECASIPLIARSKTSNE
jgi:hypothetical protein